VKGGGGLPGHVRDGDRAGIAAVATATEGWAVRGLPPSCFAATVWASSVSPRSLVSVSTYLLTTYHSPITCYLLLSPPLLSSDTGAVSQKITVISQSEPSIQPFLQISHVVCR
jgi:hypothetical protein